MSFDAFVVVVPFPFTDREASRRRPALVVSTAEFNSAHGAAVLAMITTAKRSGWTSDVEIREWSQTGLSTGCRMRMKLFTLDHELIVRRIGSLADAERVAVRTALSHALAVA